ncbi:unnamed protein product, partial [Brassica oleracea]
MASGFSGDETAPFFGFLGAAAALVFSCMGAAYGTAKSGVGVASMGVMRPELVMKSIVPVVMAGVLLVRYLWSDHSCHHQYWNQPKGQILLSLRWLRSSLLVSPVSPPVWLSASSAMPVL